jgi:hypothetical protein
MTSTIWSVLLYDSYSLPGMISVNPQILGTASSDSMVASCSPSSSIAETIETASVTPENCAIAKLEGADALSAMRSFDFEGERMSAILYNQLLVI